MGYLALANGVKGISYFAYSFPNSNLPDFAGVFSALGHALRYASLMALRAHSRHEYLGPGSVEETRRNHGWPDAPGGSSVEVWILHLGDLRDMRILGICTTA